MIANAAVAAFALESVAEQLTRVLPSLKGLPDLGEQVAGSTPSRSSRGATLKATRTVFAPRGASPSALVLLQRWLGVDERRLPGIVDDWLRSGSQRTPLLLERGGRRLGVTAATATALVLRAEAAPPASLTARELEVLCLVADGKSTAQIARELWVTPATVSKHLEHCYRKLGVESRTAALAAAGLTRQ